MKSLADAPLGERGAGEVALSGDGPLPGKRRLAPSDERIAAKVAQFVDVAPMVEGVMLLNPGFFRLERMRARSVVKERSDVRTKLRDR